MSDPANLLSKLTNSDHAVRTLRANVSSYREDGTVNLSYGTARMFNIPCLASYTNRAIGDVVQVLNLGSNAWLVIGRVGGTDPSALTPASQNLGYGQYFTDTFTGRGANDIGYEGYVGNSGSVGENSVFLAWSYYNGTTNILNAATSGKTSMTVFVARSPLLHGKREAVELQLCPHNFNALPTTMVLNTDTFSPVIFRLEVGEIRAIRLPSDWFTAMTGATPTIKGLAVQAITTAPFEAGYVIFSPTSGGFRSN